MAKQIENAGLYQELLTPFATSSEANQALGDFFDEVYALRAKYRLADVCLIVKDSIKDSGGFMWSANAGSQSEVEVMAAWHLGQVQAERQDLVRRAMESGAIMKADSLPWGVSVMAVADPNYRGHMYNESQWREFVACAPAADKPTQTSAQTKTAQQPKQPTLNLF